MRGDVILAVDGRAAGDVLAAEVAFSSGSPQWRVVRARQQFGAGAVGSALVLRIRRGDSELAVTVARGDRMPEQYLRPSIERLDDGTYYVDLRRASTANINGVMEHLAVAPGVVFDLRGYPSSNHVVLSHLLTRPDDSTTWMAVPRIVRPDHVATAIPSWETSGWAMPVREPHIRGRVAFVTGPEAVSYAESVMGLVEHYGLGAIVGSPTAGTNGNVAEITGPMGCRTRFTGMRVTKHDGARQHLVGVQPTIPAVPTIAGVIAGRDEVLEAALAYVRGASR